MINIEEYIEIIVEKLKETYFDRLVYVGLQGSYLRGEATENSDIDIMVVIDNMTIADLDNYRLIINSLEYSDKMCGFICSKTDIENWNPLEICNLINSTKDYYGNLIKLVPSYSDNDIKNYIKISINNLYHEICHRYVFSNKISNIENLKYSYKNVFFILQNLYYFENKKFIKTKSELLDLLEGKNREVLENSILLDKEKEYDFDKYFELLFTWCQDTLIKIEP